MAAQRARIAQEAPEHILVPRLVFLLSILALLLIGFVMIYSASSVMALAEAEDFSQANPASYLFDQIKFAAIGIACAVVLWRFIPYSVWAGPLLWCVWGAAVGLLLLTAVMGMTALGAQRWLLLGPISLQPSEFAKIAFILMGARILYDFRAGSLSPRDMFVQIGLLLLLPILFLFKTQSDLGTTLIIFVGILMVMWMGEVPFKVILALLGAGLAFALLASLVGYRQDRFVFLNPWNDGEGGYGAGYQLIHSLYAFSEGGIFGVGLGNSREKFLYLPEAETDFIFAIIGEELGLVGALVVIVLFIAFLYAGMRIARSAPDNFGSMIAGSCTIMIVFQAFLNIGCVVGLLPTTGKPLPFVSSGGSSLIATFIMVGLVLAVSYGAGSGPSVYERRRADLRVVRTAASTPSEGSGRGSLCTQKRSGLSQTSALGWEALSVRSARGESVCVTRGLESSSSLRRDKRRL